MGGRLTESSKVHCGSTFTFILPYKVSSGDDNSDDPDEVGDMSDHDTATEDETEGFFPIQASYFGLSVLFQWIDLSSKVNTHNFGCANSHMQNGLSEDSSSFPSNHAKLKDMASLEDACSVTESVESGPESWPSLSPHPDNQNAGCRDKCCTDVTTDRFKILTKQPTGHVEASREVDLIAKVTESQFSSQREEKSTAVSQSTSKDSPKEPLKPKILLVEDNKINVMVTQSMMKQLGHTIDLVNNGVEAVRAVQGHSYDLILMDVCMPVMDGLKATRLIRSFEETGNWDALTKAGIEHSQLSSDSTQCNWVSRTNHTPIIAMTANALPESSEECYANGMDSFVSKPVTFNKLEECLEQYLP